MHPQWIGPCSSNPMFVPPPDATFSNIRCNISSSRSQMLHGLVQYASCLPPNSSLRTSTYRWSSSAAPRLSSDRWSPATIFSLLIVDYMTETICRLLVFVFFYGDYLHTAGVSVPPPPSPPPPPVNLKALESTPELGMEGWRSSRCVSWHSAISSPPNTSSTGSGWGVIEGLNENTALM